MKISEHKTRKTAEFPIFEVNAGLMKIAGIEKRTDKIAITYNWITG